MCVVCKELRRRGWADATDTTAISYFDLVQCSRPSPVLVPPTQTTQLRFVSTPSEVGYLQPFRLTMVLRHRDILDFPR